MKKIETSIIKRISTLCILALLCVVLAACSSAPEAKGIYQVEKKNGETVGITLLNHSKKVNHFNTHINGSFEIRLESGKATVSYIYFTDVAGNKDYQTASGSTITNWRVKGKKIILEGTMGVGTLDLELKEGWVLLTYYIEGEPIYVARYKKTT